LIDEIKMALIILIPPILAIFLVAISLGENILKKGRLVSITRLHPEKGLIRQGLLWLSIFIPIFYFIVLGALAWQDCNISFTAEGFKTFINISGLPLGVLSLSLPFAVLVSRFHATEQTAKQIEIAKYKNNLDAFYAHRKELFSYFSQIGEADLDNGMKAKYKVHPIIHRVFFNGEPSDGVPKINFSAFEGIESDLICARKYIDGVIRDLNPESTFTFYLYACSAIYTLGEKLWLKEITEDLPKRSVHVPVQFENQEITCPTTIGVTTDELVHSYWYIRSYFLNLCEFALYTSSDQVKERYRNLEIGVADDKYKFIKQPLVIERLHETIIKAMSPLIVEALNDAALSESRNPH